MYPKWISWNAVGGSECFVSDDMARYIVSLISATRKHPLLSRGASPRATLSLTDMAKAVAFARAEITLCERCAEYFYLHRKSQDNSQRKSLCIKKEQRRNSARNSQKNSKAEDLKMIRNIIIYLCLLTGTFLFSIFYYAWFSWFLFLTVVSIPIISLLLSLPFMIRSVRSNIEIFAKEKCFYQGWVLHCNIRQEEETALLPILTLNIKSTNLTANLCENIKIRFSGTFTKPLIRQCNSLTQHCGQLDIVCKNGKIYDMLGIFFFRSGLKSVALFVSFQNNKNRKLSPTAVISRLRDISLSLSATAKFMSFVNTVTVTVCAMFIGAFVKKRWADCKRTECSDNQELSYNAFFGDNADEMMFFCKLMYVCRYMIKSIGICFACDRNGNPFEIRWRKRYIKLFFRTLSKHGKQLCCRHKWFSAL